MDRSNDMNGIWLISVRRLRWILVRAAVLLRTVAVVACNLNPERVEAVTPSASVAFFPSTYCIGETLTVRWDGGPQVGTCDTPQSVDNCKGASVRVVPTSPSGLSVAFGFDARNLNGSSSGAADFLTGYVANYLV